MKPQSNRQSSRQAEVPQLFADKTAGGEIPNGQSHNVSRAHLGHSCVMKITIVKSHECAATDFRSDDGKDAKPLHGGPEPL